ncbi:MAG: AAA family ATPase [Candidatus Anstonellales archaeon]
MKKEEIILKVSEALQNDVGRGIARIDSKARNALGVSAGDVVLLIGKKQTPAIVWPAHPEDEGLGIIRMDGILRQNASVGLGDRIKVVKSEIKDASKVILAPREPIRYTPGFDQYVHRRLIGKPIMKGNILPVGVFGTAIPLVVMQTTPPGPVMVTEETKLSIKPEIVKELENVPTVTYDDIGGLKDAIAKIREMVELPLRHPELFERLGIEPPKGVLLYGPPGTGKTLLAKAVATESNANFIAIHGPEVLSKWVGESEKTIREIFRKARQAAPCIIFIDEIDAIAPKRGLGESSMVMERVVDTLLTEMDGLRSLRNVVVIAATNRPDILDVALLRAGRFDKLIEIPIPDERTRLEIFKVHTKKMPLDRSVDLAELAKITEGYTGADIENLVREAGMMAIRTNSKNVSMKMFMEAMREIRPSAGADEKKRIEKFKVEGAMYG